MITGTKTIAQYKIMQWVDDNFFEGSVTVTFVDDSNATITDKKGDTMKVSYSPETGIVEES